jgi:hypothetical protein
VVVVCEPDAIKNELYLLALWWAVVTDSPSQIVVMAQTEYSIAGGNPDGHAQGGKLY